MVIKPFFNFKSDSFKKVFCAAQKSEDVFFIQSGYDQPSISSTFYVRIFHTKVIRAAFFYLHVTKEKLPKKLSYEKRVRKTLMKLTSRFHLSIPPFCCEKFLAHRHHCRENASPRSIFFAYVRKKSFLKFFKSQNLSLSISTERFTDVDNHNLVKFAYGAVSMTYLAIRGL